MQVTIISFGPLKEILGNEPLLLSDVHDTEEAIAEMNRRFPELADKVFILAVDKQIVREKTKLKNQCTVALLPPFSGG
jgi:sulfur-carrier protein